MKRTILATVFVLASSVAASSQTVVFVDNAGKEIGPMITERNVFAYINGIPSTIVIKEDIIGENIPELLYTMDGCSGEAHLYDPFVIKTAYKESSSPNLIVAMHDKIDIIVVVTKTGFDGECSPRPPRLVKVSRFLTVNVNQLGWTPPFHIHVK